MFRWCSYTLSVLLPFPLYYLLSSHMPIFLSRSILLPIDHVSAILIFTNSIEQQVSNFHFFQMHTSSTVTHALCFFYYFWIMCWMKNWWLFSKLFISFWLKNYFVVYFDNRICSYWWILVSVWLKVSYHWPN